MDPFYSVILLALLAGLAMPAGAFLACVESVKPRLLESELRHGITAFGGGALLSAVALVLVPEGIQDFSPWAAAVLFLFGGLAFMGLDIYLSKSQTSMSQLAAMLSDFIPECLALGSAVALGSDDAVLIAVLIAMQNLPEGFNAYQELKVSSSFSVSKIIFYFFLLALCGPIAGGVAYVWLSEWPVFISGLMLFASGGILYAVFQDIAPRVVLEKHWAPPMGAVMGFVLGLVGYMMTQ